MQADFPVYDHLFQSRGSTADNRHSVHHHLNGYVAALLGAGLFYLYSVLSTVIVERIAKSASINGKLTLFAISKIFDQYLYKNGQHNGCRHNFFQPHNTKNRHSVSDLIFCQSTQKHLSMDEIYNKQRHNTNYTNKPKFHFPANRNEATPK